MYDRPSDESTISVTLSNNARSNSGTNTSKRLRPTTLARERTFATSASAFINNVLTLPAGISRSLDTPSTTSSRTESSGPVQFTGFRRPAINIDRSDELSPKPRLIRTHFENITQLTAANKQTDVIATKTTTAAIVDETQIVGDDDWVCPVAVALRKAGFNVR